MNRDQGIVEHRSTAQIFGKTALLGGILLWCLFPFFWLIMTSLKNGNNALNSPELLDLLLPVLRADIEMVETYKYAPEPPLDVDILAIGGRDDPAISQTDLEAWRRQTAGEFQTRIFVGGHFFPFWTANTAPAPDVLQLIAEQVKQIANSK